MPYEHRPAGAHPPHCRLSRTPRARPFPPCVSQFLNGLNWPTLDGEQTTVNTRDCPTPEGVPLRANNFLDTSAFGGFVLPCNCYGDCLSPISVGRGITLTQGQQETGKLLYWTATREAAVYIVDDVPSPPSTGNPSPPPSTGNPSPPPSTGNSSPPPSTDKFRWRAWTGMPMPMSLGTCASASASASASACACASAPACDPFHHPALAYCRSHLLNYHPSPPCAALV